MRSRRSCSAARRCRGRRRRSRTSISARRASRTTRRAGCRRRLAAGCWLADVYALQGRHDDARRLFDRVLAAANDLGLLSEESWPDGRAMGNFPQALSHVALINTALSLAAGGRPPRLAGGEA